MVSNYGNASFVAGMDAGWVLEVSLLLAGVAGVVAEKPSKGSWRFCVVTAITTNHDFCVV